MLFCDQNFMKKLCKDKFLFTYLCHSLSLDTNDRKEINYGGDANFKGFSTLTPVVQCKCDSCNSDTTPAPTVDRKWD